MLRRFSFRTTILAALFLCCGAMSSARALDFPEHTGRVVDEAGVLNSATRDSLARKFAAMEEKSQDRIAVVTLSSLRGMDIDNYARSLGVKWALGTGGHSNGALLILAPNEGKVAVQAGLDVQRKLTDPVLTRIVNETLIPKLKADDVAGALSGGIDEISRVLAGPAAPAVVAQVPASSPQDSASGYPALSGRVVDAANILSSNRDALVDKLAALEGKTTDQLVVATVRSLQGNSIEDYANRLFRKWRLGQKDKNNGVLLLVAPNERKVRIEVGYGVEGTLTDAIASFIIQNSILPRFRAGDFPGGINRGVDDIIQVLTGDAEEWKRRAAPPQPQSQPQSQPSLFDNTFAPLLAAAGGMLAVPAQLLLVLIFGLMFLVFFLAIGAIILSLIIQFLTWIGLIPKPKKRTGFWHYLNYLPTESSSSSSSGSSSYSSSGSFDSGGFSGGGGDSGGGGSSGSW